MRKTLIILRNEISNTLRRKTYLIFAFGLPLVIGVIALAFMFARRDQASSVNPAIVTQAETTPRLAQGFVDESGWILAQPDSEGAGSLQQFSSRQQAQLALQRGEIAGYFVIAEDYLDSGDLRYVVGDYNPLAGDIDSDEMEWLLVFSLLAGDQNMAERIRRPLRTESLSLAADQRQPADDNWFVELFPTIMVLIIYMIILIPAGILVNAVTDEKKNRVMEVLMSSVSARQLLTGKILALGVLGLAQTLVWFGVMALIVVYGARPLGIPEDFTLPVGLIVWSCLFILCGYAIYGSQLAGVGALASDAKETRSANFLVLAPMILSYMFMIFILERPDSGLSIFLSLFPLTAPIGMTARLAVTEVPLWQPVLSLALQLLFVILTLRLIARLFRAQTLLSGQPFSARRYYLSILGRV